MELPISSPNRIVAAASITLSLFLAYFPVVKVWYTGLDSGQKVSVLGGAILLVALAMVGISCAGLQPLVPCTQAGLWAFMGEVFEAFMVGAGSAGVTYLMAVRPFKADKDQPKAA